MTVKNEVDKDLFHYYIHAVRLHLGKPIVERSEIDQVLRQYFDRVKVEDVKFE